MSSLGNVRRTPPGASRAGAPAWKAIFVCAGLAALTFAVYGRTLGHDFVNFDDDVHVYQNEHVTTGLTVRNVVWAFGIHGPSQWHPLSWLSHQLDCELFGLKPWGHHLTNLLLHAASAVLLYLVLDRMTGFGGVSLFVAALYAVHPINVESVAWVSERRNVLSALFWMLTLLAYVSYARHGGWKRYALVTASFALGLMAKPMLVTLPCVLLLLDVWPLGRWPANREHRGNPEEGSGGLAWLVLEKVPLLALSAASSVLTVLCQQSAQVIAALDALPMSVRIANALVAYWDYLFKLVWPADLAVFYPHPGLHEADPMAVLFWPAVISSLALAGITGGTLLLFRRRPYLAVGWFWFLGTLVPMIGLVQVGNQRMADRYAYLAQIGLFLGVAMSVASRGFPGKALWRRVAPVAVGLYAAVAWWQVGHWRDSVSLFQHTAAVTERNHWAHNNLGLALFERGRVYEAIAHYRLALQYVPDYALAHYNLGLALQEQGLLAEATFHFEEALRLRPGDPATHARLGAALAQQGNLEAAVTHFRSVLHHGVDDAVARFNLGLSLARLGELEESIVHLRASLQMQPESVKTLFTLAIALRDTGELDEARQHLVRALELAPAFAEIENALGEILVQLGEREQARFHFQAVLQREPRHAPARRNLDRLRNDD